MASQKDFIEVFIRVRESDQPSPKISFGQKQILIDKHAFKFDHVFPPKSSQEQIFGKVCQKMVQNAIKGYNSCVFVYGQTGSGKTYTMSGDKNGLMQKSFRKLFENVRSSNSEIDVKCSYFQIYNQQISDLLDPQKIKKLNVRQNGNKGVFIENLHYESANSAEKLEEYLQIGLKNRKIGQTQANHQSSRSHSLFQLILANTQTQQNSIIVKKSRMYFVDLAGSERQNNTKATGERLKQANIINKSLTNLGIVVKTLSDDKQSSHVPYRNSKLTYILKSCLSKNSKTYLIATISNAQQSLNQTLSTLNFANRAKMIPVQAKIQEKILKIKKQIENQKNESKTAVKSIQKTKSIPKPTQKSKTPKQKSNCIQEQSLQALQIISQCQVSQEFSQFIQSFLRKSKTLSDEVQNQNQEVCKTDISQQQKLKFRIQNYRKNSIRVKQTKQENLILWNIPDQSPINICQKIPALLSLQQQILVKNLQIQFGKIFFQAKISQLSQNLQKKESQVSFLQKKLLQVDSKDDQAQQLDQLKSKLRFYDQKFKLMEKQYKKIKSMKKQESKQQKIAFSFPQIAPAPQLTKDIQNIENKAPNMNTFDEQKWRNLAILTQKYQSLKSHNLLLLTQNVYLKKRIRNLQEKVDPKQQDSIDTKRKIRKLNA